MAWTNYGYMELSSDALRLAGARAFYSELLASVQANVSADGKSRDSSSLNQLIAQVRKDIADLEMKTGATSSPRVMVADYRGPQ